MPEKATLFGVVVDLGGCCLGCTFAPEKQVLAPKNGKRSDHQDENSDHRLQDLSPSAQRAKTGYSRLVEPFQRGYRGSHTDDVEGPKPPPLG
jgi:hypothetical protein